MVKNLICNVANNYGFRRLRKILYADKRGNCSSVLKKLEATQFFTTVIAKAQNVNLLLKIDLNFNVSLFLKIDLNFNVNLLKYLSHILCVLIVESVVTNETACLFYGILPLFKCCVPTIIPVSLILMHKWRFKCIHKETA